MDGKSRFFIGLFDISTAEVSHNYIIEVMNTSFDVGETVACAECGDKH